MRVAVIADTHIPRRARDLAPGTWRQLEAADVVLHAGDVTSAAFLQRLRDNVRELFVVRGNNDVELGELDESVQLSLGGVSVAMLHDSGPSSRRRERLRARFPQARVVVFGHSHIPLLDDDGRLMLLNPGSPTDRRRMPAFTMAWFSIEEAEVRDAHLVDLGLERALIP